MEWTVVGKGPAGLLAASILTLHGEKIRIVAEHEGSLGLWSGCLDYGQSSCLSLTLEQWQRLWRMIMRLWASLGVPSHMGAGYTMTCTGLLKPTFLCPSWQYFSTNPAPVWIVGFDGLVDSLQEVHAARLEDAIGKGVSWQRLPKPLLWREDWTTMTWAAFLETEEGLQWLRAHLTDLNAKIPPGWPLLLPQVVGYSQTLVLLRNLAHQFHRRIFEYPLITPALGGMRIRGAWQAWLRGHDVPIIAGRVTDYRHNRVVLDDGRSWPTDHVILATGGLLGGGMRIRPSGNVEETISHRTMGTIRGDNWDEVFRLGVTAEESVSACGRERAGWDPDRDHNGGLMLLGTVYQSLSEQGLDILMSEAMGA